MMTYKETLFFIGKCLTINHEKHNFEIVEKHLKNNEVDWESVVKVSTAHYVFPALYCNLKKADFLKYLPLELVEYMQHITDLNRERNQQIIAQAKEINQLLLENNITPIFLKGTGNLLEGLYDDIVERMVGDIDFLVDKKEYNLGIELLKEFGYDKVHNTKYDIPMFKHYPRMNKESKTAAIEIHKEILLEEFADEFNYKFVLPNTIKENKLTFLSYKDQLSLSIIAKQINDKGQHYKDISLRNAYDVFLLSKKCDSKNAVKRFEKLFNPLNNFLAICNEVFNEVDSLSFIKNKNSSVYVREFYNLLDNSKLRKNHQKRTKRKITFNTRLNVLKKSLISKEHRTWLFYRISTKEWQQQKLIQLGLKKPKPNS